MCHIKYLVVLYTLAIFEGGKHFLIMQKNFQNHSYGSNFLISSRSTRDLIQTLIDPRRIISLKVYSESMALCRSRFSLFSPFHFDKPKSLARILPLDMTLFIRNFHL